MTSRNIYCFLPVSSVHCTARKYRRLDAFLLGYNGFRRPFCSSSTIKAWRLKGLVHSESHPTACFPPEGITSRAQLKSWNVSLGHILSSEAQPDHIVYWLPSNVTTTTLDMASPSR